MVSGKLEEKSVLRCVFSGMGVWREPAVSDAAGRPGKMGISDPEATGTLVRTAGGLVDCKPGGSGLRTGLKRPVQIVTPLCEGEGKSGISAVRGKKARILEKYESENVLCCFTLRTGLQRLFEC